MPDTTRCSWWRGQAALAARWVHNAITQEGGVGEAASEPHRIKFLVALEQDGVLLRDPKSCQSLKLHPKSIYLLMSISRSMRSLSMSNLMSNSALIPYG